MYVKNTTYNGFHHGVWSLTAVVVEHVELVIGKKTLSLSLSIKNNVLIMEIDYQTNRGL